MCSYLLNAWSRSIFKSFFLSLHDPCMVATVIQILALFSISKYFPFRNCYPTVQLVIHSYVPSIYHWYLDISKQINYEENWLFIFRSAHFHGAFGVHESSLLRLFPPNVARNCILYGCHPPPPPPPSIQALLAHGGPYWAPRHMPNFVGLEPLVFNQGSSRASLSTDSLQPNPTSTGTSMEHGPFNFDAI